MSHENEGKRHDLSVRNLEVFVILNVLVRQDVSHDVENASVSDHEHIFTNLEVRHDLL